MQSDKYSSRLIKATALINDTKVLLSAWDLSLSVNENFDQASRANIFGKASRSRIEDILPIFRQRFFDDPEVGQALVALTQARVPAQWIDPLLYYYAAKSDLTLHDLVIKVLQPRLMSGYRDITVEQLMMTLREWVQAGRTTKPWNEKTMLRVAQHALAALRDFGVLEGATSKSIATIYLAVEAFAFLAFEIARQKSAGELVLKSDEWRLFFLPTTGVERFFLEAHQEKLLFYQAAGSVTRLEFPANNLVEYADVLAQRARSQA